MSDFEKTVDGYELSVGDTVWVREPYGESSLSLSRDQGGEDTWKEYIVGEVFPKKIAYQNPQPDGYLGAKMTIVFKRHPREHIREAIGLLSSMVECGDEHSTTSIEVRDRALKMLKEI